jgi:hypothetical protein
MTAGPHDQLLTHSQDNRGDTMGVSLTFPSNPTTEDIFRARIFEGSYSASISGVM